MELPRFTILGQPSRFEKGLEVGVLCKDARRERGCQRLKSVGLRVELEVWGENRKSPESVTAGGGGVTNTTSQIFGRTHADGGREMGREGGGCPRPQARAERSLHRPSHFPLTLIHTPRTLAFTTRPHAPPALPANVHLFPTPCNRGNSMRRRYRSRRR